MRNENRCRTFAAPKLNQMKHAINYAGGYWHWESEHGSGVEHTRDGAEIEYAKSFLKKKQEPDWEHLLCISPDDKEWILTELKKQKNGRK